jgi:hypothetical protein
MWNPFAFIGKLFQNPLVAKFNTFIKDLFSGTLGVALAMIQGVANDVVAQVEADPSIIMGILDKSAQGEAKRTAARKLMDQILKTRGMEAANSEKNLAIELAVQDMNLKKPTA